MDKISRISSYVLYGLLTISLVLTGMMLFGGTNKSEALESPVFTDVILNWGKILIVGSIAIAFLIEIFNMVTRPTGAKKSLVSAGIILFILMVSYILSDGTPMEILGYEGADNVPSMLKATDTGLFTFYLLMGIAVVAIIASEIWRIIKS